ncbi:MAG: ASPIC/UnbV domain-containing protein, partial [Vicinamibacterales bacterium]
VRTAHGGRSIFREVTDGGSFGSGSFRQDIGLGDATAIEALEVFWPASGLRQTFDDVPLDRAIAVREGQPDIRVIAREPFTLGAAGNGHRHLAASPSPFSPTVAERR